MFELENVNCGILKIDTLKTGSQPLTLVTGPSGGGKTTLLRLLCGLLPYSGKISFDGLNILSVNPVLYRRRVTMVSQASFIINGSIADNINYMRHLLGKKPADTDEIKRALETVILPKKPTDSAETLSGGEKQRLCLSRVLFAQPQMLLLDEPASALDFDTAKTVLQNVTREMCGRGCHVMVVSHWAETVAGPAERLNVKDGVVTKGDLVL
jgi:putative ABC transport system ATP-binding protein